LFVIVNRRRVTLDAPRATIHFDFPRELMTDKTLTRADLTDALHEEVGLSRQDCAGLVERTLDLVAEAMERGDIVKLSGFGVFQVRSKRERMGRNPKTGEPATIAPRRVIGFRASQVLKARVDRALEK
jgi:integration host factor subunit alpha